MNPSARLIPSPTPASSTSIDRDSVSRDETVSNSPRPAWWRASAAASCALSSANPAWAATPASTSSSSSVGLRPESGSSTEMMPSSSPPPFSSGTNSASSGCQASGSSLAAMSGVNESMSALQSYSPAGTR